MASSFNATDIVNVVIALTRIPVVGDFLRSLIENFVAGGGNGNVEHKTIADEVLKNIGPNVTREWLDEKTKKENE